LDKPTRKPGKQTKPGSRTKYINSPIHQELLKRLRIRAIEDDTTISALMHGLLCREFSRMDLIEDLPEPIKQVAAVAS
jgi:hypothetical protein